MQIGITHLVGGLVVLALIIGGAFMIGTKWNSPEVNTASAAAAVEDGSATSSEEVEEDEPEEELYDVIKVVDGDTIAISMNGKSETIRLIGIDTPETVDPRTAVQCFGKEATAKLKSIIGKRVGIERDEREGERDKYDRLLAYIYTEEGLFLNKYMIEQGFAFEYTYDDPYKYQKEFKAAQADAKAKKRGLWAPGACPEPKKATPAAKAVPTPTPVSGAPPQPVQMQVQTPPQETQLQVQQQPQESAPQPKAEPAPPPPAPITSSSNYTCSANTYNCTDFTTHAEAQAVYDQCGGAASDIHKLDSNKDGEACESLP